MLFNIWCSIRKSPLWNIRTSVTILDFVWIQFKYHHTMYLHIFRQLFYLTSTESVPGVAKCFGIFVPVISTLYLSTNPGGTFVPVISTLYLSTCLHWKVPVYLSTLEGTCPYWRVPLLGRSTLEGTCPHWRVPLLRPTFRLKRCVPWHKSCVPLA